MKVAYAPVSSESQNLERQLDNFLQNWDDCDFSSCWHFGN